MATTIRDKNEDGDNSSMAIVFKILEYQQFNEDAPVPNTSYSSHFIDVQLNSLLSTQTDFSTELFSRLVDMCADINVCQHIWRNYQELFAKVIINLDRIGDFSAPESLPVYASYFLRIIARLFYAQVDLTGKEKVVDPDQLDVGTSFCEINQDAQASADNILIDEDLIDETAFKSTFQEIGFIDFHKLFEVSIKLFGSSCPQTLAACLKVIEEMLHRTYVRYDEMLAVIGSEGFMSKLHFIMTCSTNDDLQHSIGKFLKCFSFKFASDFHYFLPLIQSVLLMREERFSSSLMDALTNSLLQIENWPMDTDFYEFLNLFATKLNGFEDLSEAKQKFHERLASHNNAIFEARA